MSEAFPRKNGLLFCEDVNVSEVAAETSTPFYMYSKTAIQENLREFQKELNGYDSLVAYALKANSNKAIIRTMAENGAGADVVSRGEVYRALKAGIPAENIVFAGVGKKEDEIRYALREGILGFNVESLAELRTIEQIAGQTGGKAPIAMRVNPGVDPGTHPYTSTGGSSSKFGVSRSKALRGFEIARKSENLEAVGIHAHIGSQIDSLDPYEKTASFLGELVDELSGSGYELNYVDFGGGFGIDQRGSDTSKSPAIRDFISAILEGFGEKRNKYKLIVEPGRAIVGPAGVIVGEVIRKKETHSKTYLVTDVGMNDMIRPALYGSEHEIVPLNLKSGRVMEKVDVVGPLCESGDFLARGRELPEMNPGEYFAVLDGGAYGASMASNYNSRTKGPEVLVKGSDYEVVREKETIEDLI